MTVYSDRGTSGCACGGPAFFPDTQVILTGINQYDLMKFRINFRTQRVLPVTFSIYLAGTLVGTISANANGSGQYDLQVQPGTSPWLEIVDDPNGIPHYAASGSLLLNWRQIGGAANYLVQQYQGSTWVTLQTLPETGKGNTLYNTPWQADDELSQWQVVPQDNTGANGTPISWEVFVVRSPDVPNITATLNSNRTMTFTVS